MPLLSIAAGCRNCDGPEPLPPLPPDQLDVFTQVESARVDILWVIDNSSSMALEQEKLADRFGVFFAHLVAADVDYHIGVVTTDAGEGGALREFNGVVDGCDRCAVLDRGVADAEAVFVDLVSVGVDGASFEQGFATAVDALDGRNAGFVRDDAALVVVFVSDEDESAGGGDPVRHFQRALEGLKPAGDEARVSVAAITGYPQENPPVSLDLLCEVLATTFDSDPNNEDLRAARVTEALRSGPGCQTDDTEANVGGRYLELACRTGGVVANLCDADYANALDDLGVAAAGLRRKFTISEPQRSCPSGQVGLDCDDNGSFDDAVDGSVCVVAQCDGDAEPVAQPRGSVWEFEGSTSSVRFTGACVPAAGSAVSVRYCDPG